MNPRTRGLKVIGYVRVSTADQVDRGAGLEAQREALSAAAAQRGWDLVDVVTDEGESGGKSHEKRPGLCEAIARIEAGEAEALAVAKLDRLSRSVRDLADLAERSKPKGKRKGWGLILLDIDVDTSSPSGEFMVNVMGSAAQWERRIISQRTKDALAVKRAQGVRLGRPSTLTQELVERIVREHRDGGTYSGIARALTTDGVPTAHGGGRWWPATVRKVLLGQAATSVR
jgi:DNA invertase Pin-like site-specific DNA recombinase